MRRFFGLQKREYMEVRHSLIDMKSLPRVQVPRYRYGLMEPIVAEVRHGIK